MNHSNQNKFSPFFLAIASSLVIGISQNALAHDWTRYFTFSNDNEARIHYSFEDDGTSLTVDFLGNQGTAAAEEVYSGHGRFHALGQRDSRNPTQKSSLNQEFRIPTWTSDTQNFFWLKNFTHGNTQYFFEDGTTAISCVREWQNTSVKLITFEGQRYLLESVRKHDGSYLYLSRNLTGQNCLSLSHPFMPQLHDSVRVEVSASGVLKVGDLETLIDLKTRCLLHSVKGRGDFAVRVCQEAGPNQGSSLVRLADQKQYQLTDKVWTPAQIASSTQLSNGVFESKGASSSRIDLDQFDAELRRLAFRGHGDTVLDDKGRKVNAVETVRTKYTDLVADSIAHPDRYRESSDRDITQHFLEALWGRRSVVLLGKPGTGKSSAVRAFARDVGLGLVKGVPRTTEIFEIKVSSLLSGTTFVGMTEQRVGELISAAQQTGCLYFIDEFHSLAGAGTSSNNSNDVTQYLKKGLEAGELLLIGTDTDHEFYNSFAHDPAFVERFDIKKLNAPQGEVLSEIIRARFKSEYNLDLNPALIQLAIELSQNYDVTASQPRSAVNLLKKAVARGAAAAGLSSAEITPQMLKEAAVVKYGFDPFQLNPASLRSKLAQLRPGLDAELIGQDEAKNLVQSVWARKITGVGDDRHVNSLLMAGPPGVGKTRIAELSADLMGYKKTVVEMNKFAHGGVDLFRREIYQALLEHPFRVIILDEIEKAHSTVQAGALAMLQTGLFKVTEEMPHGKTVTREVSAKHALFMLTSNAAGAYIKRELSRGGALDDKELRRYLAEDDISEAILSRLRHIVPMSTPSQPEFKAGLTRSLAATLARESARHGVRFTMANQDEFITEMMKSYHEDTDFRDITKLVSEIEDLIVQALMSEEHAPGSEVKLIYKESEPSRKKPRRGAAPYLSYYN